MRNRKKIKGQWYKPKNKKCWCPGAGEGGCHVSAQTELISSPSLFHPFRTARKWMMSPRIDWEQFSFLNLVIKTLIASGVIPTGTSRNNVLPVFWVSLSPGKLTQKFKIKPLHQSYHTHKKNIALVYSRIFPGFFSFSSVQLLSRVWLFVTPWTAARQNSLSIASSWSLLKLMSIQSVMPFSHLILCRPLLLPPSIFSSIRIFSNESPLHVRWPKYWSFSFNICLSNEYSGLISSRMDWLDLHAVQESSPTPQFKSINSSALRFLYSPILTSIHDYWKNHSLDWMDLF